jgi:hypothetical protein
MMDGYLKLVNGNVFLYNGNAQKIKVYYSGGDATRVDWENKEKGIIQVQLKDGRLFIINNDCQITKRL